MGLGSEQGQGVWVVLFLHRFHFLFCSLFGRCSWGLGRRFDLYILSIERKLDVWFLDWCFLCSVYSWGSIVGSGYFLHHRRSLFGRGRRGVPWFFDSLVCILYSFWGWFRSLGSCSYTIRIFIVKIIHKNRFYSYIVLCLLIYFLCRSHILGILWGRCHILNRGIDKVYNLYLFHHHNTLRHIYNLEEFGFFLYRMHRFYMKYLKIIRRRHIYNYTIHSLFHHQFRNNFLYISNLGIIMIFRFRFYIECIHLLYWYRKYIWIHIFCIQFQHCYRNTLYYIHMYYY